MRNLLVAFFAFFLVFSHETYAKSMKLEAGHWHAEFQLNDSTILPVSFLFDKEKKLSHLWVINADEHLEIKNVSFSGDSIFMHFDMFDSELRVKRISKTEIIGNWYNHAKKNNYHIPFKAINNHAPRFNAQPSLIDVLGKWETYFDYRGDKEKALGIFEPNSISCSHSSGTNKIKGTFLTETGDYRFLEGAVSNDSLYLSTFDGSHAFLFNAKLVNDTLWGNFYSGKHYHTTWYAVRNEHFELGNPDSLTYVINDQPISFELPDDQLNMYHYPNSSLENKVHLIQIMGTWCPNCMDESLYLKQVYSRHKNDLEILAVTFETPPTLEEKAQRISTYKASLGLEYTFLLGGDACKSCASELFSSLSNILSFPTLIFIDKKGKIRKIHTGFSGPGTGKYYTDFVNETDKFILELIEEN